MGNFRKGSEKRFGSRGDGFSRRDGDRGGFGWGRDPGPITMHQATCAQCGKPCEVPFKPNGRKPVYCNTCFEGKRETENNWSGDRFSQKKYNNYKAPIKTDFASNINRGDNDEVRKQLEILNAKMDSLIKALEAMAATQPLVAEKKLKKDKSDLNH
jgi:CxxC-x17-CxxC domain-containing protein